MPVVFVGHGNPMNAIEKNKYSAQWSDLGNSLPRPNAILCISAHWETYGTQLTAMQKPKTIHDFGGFPRELFEVKYPAEGFPLLAEEIIENTKSPSIQADFSDWGLDHGCWSVLKNMYPNADIPVVQMSLNRNMTPQQHLELAAEMSFLRSHGVLIISSGNIVHNLGLVDWYNLTNIYDWAAEMNEKVKSFIMNCAVSELVNYRRQGDSFKRGIPTNEHFLPLLYTIGAMTQYNDIHFFNDEIIMGSLSMTSFVLK
jgi:4,5-DOPA dioxygenase extradiol